MLKGLLCELDTLMSNEKSPEAEAQLRLLQECSHLLYRVKPGYRPPKEIPRRWQSWFQGLDAGAVPHSRKVAEYITTAGIDPLDFIEIIEPRLLNVATEGGRLILTWRAASSMPRVSTLTPFGVLRQRLDIPAWVATQLFQVSRSALSRYETLRALPKRALGTLSRALLVADLQDHLQDRSAVHAFCEKYLEENEGMVRLYWPRDRSIDLEMQDWTTPTDLPIPQQAQDQS